MSYPYCVVNAEERFGVHEIIGQFKELDAAKRTAIAIKGIVINHPTKLTSDYIRADIVKQNTIMG